MVPMEQFPIHNRLPVIKYLCFSNIDRLILTEYAIKQKQNSSQKFYWELLQNLSVE